MNGLEQARMSPRRVEVRTGRRPEAARRRGGEVAEHVSEQVAGDDHVQRGRIAHDPGGKRVDQQAVVLDL